VQFPHGLPKIDHAIVMVEVFERVELNQFDLDTAYFPLNFNETPISYFSGNDFLNLVVALRTTSDLLAYLNARRLLPPSDLHVIGDEKSLFEFYLLNGGTFEGCASRRDVTIAVSEQQDRLKDILATKRESDSYSGLLEDVADKLATRLPDYASNLPQHLLASFDPPDARAGYLEMQRILTGLRLRERAELGRSFYSVVDKVANETNTFTYRSAYLDLHPAWVFVFAASRGIDREEVLSRNTNLMRGAVAFYGKNCLLVTDRDGANYEVGIARQGSSPTTDEQEIGRRFFGHLRITDVSLDRV